MRQGTTFAMRAVRLFYYSHPCLMLSNSRAIYYLIAHYLHLGLYFKLHGIHRPTSMKRTVIKRRRRIPAAAYAVPALPPAAYPAAMTTMSDQAAAEALVAVGQGQQYHQYGYRPASAAPVHAGQVRSRGADDVDEVDQLETEQPAKKKARKSAQAPSQDVVMGEAQRRSPSWIYSQAPPSAYQTSARDSASPQHRRTQSPSASSPQPTSSTRPGGAPSLAELESHYAVMVEERRRMLQLLERTDVVMEGVWKGIEEMRRSQTPVLSVPLPSRREGTREVAWSGVAPSSGAGS